MHSTFLFEGRPPEDGSRDTDRSYAGCTCLIRRQRMYLFFDYSLCTLWDVLCIQIT